MRLREGLGAALPLRRKARREASPESPDAASRRRKLRSVAGKSLAVAGVVAACVFLAVVVGDSDYKATLFGWLPLFVVLAAIVLARVYLSFLKRGLVLMGGGTTRSCMRGEDATFSVGFQNKTVLLFFRIEAYFYMSDLLGNRASEAMTTLALSPRESYELEFKTKFDHVGTYTTGLDRVVITDFLRLFTATVKSDVRQHVQVSPRIQPIGGIDFANQSIVENAAALRSVLADSLDYAYVREYVWGDPIKNIHWKISARTETYMTRLYEVYTNPGIAIFMGFFAEDGSPDVTMQLFDAVVESAFSIGGFAREQGMDVEICYENRSGERVVRSSWRSDEMAEIIAELPQMDHDPALKASTIGMLSSHIGSQYGYGNMVVCTADVSDDLVSTVLAAKSGRRSPMVIAAVPSTLVGKERQDYCASLLRLDAAEVPYVVLSRAEELSGLGEL